MISVTKTSVHKSWIVGGSCLIEQVICYFRSSNRFLFCIHQEFLAQYISFMEVHDTQVIKAAKNIKMNLIPHEGGPMIERIVPHKFQITNHSPMRG